MNIIGTGLSGLVGSRVVELLSGKHSFRNLSLETGVDITDTEKLSGIISGSGASWVFHFAAKTDVDACEADRAMGTSGGAWIINAKATRDIADICRRSNMRMLYISTDYVFDGKRGNYTEEDTPNPQGWYGMTKYEGEKAVGEEGLIIRIANPYRAGRTGKTDFMHKILDRLEKNEPVAAPADGIFSPTFIDDIAAAIDTLISEGARGIYHVTGDAVSQFESARLIARTFGYDPGVIGKIPFAQYFKNRAPRPMQASMNHDKINARGINMRNFENGLAAVKQQEGAIL